jgi:predicted PurR-regulated permease PerM
MKGTDACGDTPAPQQADARPAVDLTRIVLATSTLLLLIGGSLYVLTPFVPALIWSAMIVVATWPALIGIQRHLNGRRAAAVAVLLLVQLVVIIIPIYAAIATIAHRAADITAFVHVLPTYALPSPPSWLSRIPVVGARFTHQWQKLSDAGPGGVLAQIQPYAAVVAHWTLARASQLGIFLLYLLLTLMICGLLYAKGEFAAGLLTRVAERITGDNGPEIIRLVGQSIRAIALGVVVTAILQASLGALGVWFAGVPYAGIIGAILLIACLVQIGPLLPLLCCVAWLFLSGSRIAAILLLVWSIAVTMLDNVLRPILIRRAVELPIILILFGVLGGLLSIGVVGLFLGPVILAVTYHLLLAWIDMPDSSRASTDVKTAIEPADTTGTPAKD